MPVCVLVGDEIMKINTETNHIGKKIDKHCHFIKLGIMLEKKTAVWSKTESAFQTYPYT